MDERTPAVGLAGGMQEGFGRLMYVQFEYASRHCERSEAIFI